MSFLDPRVLPTERVYAFQDTCHFKLGETLLRAKTAEVEPTRFPDFDGWCYTVRREEGEKLITLRIEHEHMGRWLAFSVPPPEAESHPTKAKAKASRTTFNAFELLAQESMRYAGIKIVKAKPAASYARGPLQNNQDADVDLSDSDFSSHQPASDDDDEIPNKMKSNTLVLKIHPDSVGLDREDPSNDRVIQWIARLPVTILKLPVVCSLLHLREEINIMGEKVDTSAPDSDDDLFEQRHSEGGGLMPICFPTAAKVLNRSTKPRGGDANAYAKTIPGRETTETVTVSGRPGGSSLQRKEVAPESGDVEMKDAAGAVLSSSSSSSAASSPVSGNDDEGGAAAIIGEDGALLDVAQARCPGDESRGAPGDSKDEDGEDATNDSNGMKRNSTSAIHHRKRRKADPGGNSDRLPFAFGVDKAPRPQPTKARMAATFRCHFSEHPIWIFYELAERRICCVVGIHYEDELQSTIGQLACQEFHDAKTGDNHVACQFSPYTAPPKYKDLDPENLGQQQFSVGCLVFALQAKAFLVRKKSKEEIAEGLIPPSTSTDTHTNSSSNASSDAHQAVQSTYVKSLLEGANFVLLSEPEIRVRMSFLAQYVIGVRQFLNLHIASAKSNIYSRMRVRVKELQESVAME